jgi:hypothetical protein
LLSDSPPELFLDRSLGRYTVANALREAGATVITMAEVYGERVGQGLPDTEWLRDAGARNWVVLLKDDKIRYRPAELDALMAARVRAFCLPNGNLKGAVMAERYVQWLPAILATAAVQPGPYIFGVYSDGVRPIWPR